MGRTAARSIVGMGLVVVALLATRGVAGSQAAPAAEVTPSPVVLHGSVAADGTWEAPQGGVNAGRAGVGRYLVVAEGSSEVLVTSWDAVAEVVVTPVTGDAVVVTFMGADGLPVDSGFRFRGLVS